MAQKNPTKKQLAVKNAEQNGTYPSYSGCVMRYWNGHTTCDCGYNTCDGHCAVGWSIGGFVLMLVITLLMARSTPAVPALGYLIPLAIGLAMNGGTIAALIGTWSARSSGYKAELAKLEENDSIEYHKQCIALAREEAQAKYEKAHACCEAAQKKLEEKRAFIEKTRKWIEERNVAEKEKCLRSNAEELARVEQEIAEVRKSTDKLRLDLDDKLSRALKAEADLQIKMARAIKVDYDTGSDDVADKLAEISESITGEAPQTLRTDEDVERVAAELVAKEEERERRETRRTRD